MQRRVNSVQRSNKPEFRLVNNQRNSQIANQMRASDVATFGYAENLRAKQWPACQVGFLSPPQQQYSSWKTALTKKTLAVKSTTLWLSVWKKWCLERGIAEEIENYEQTQLNTLPERFYAKIKSKHDRKGRFHFIESDSDSNWTIPWSV